MSSTDRSTSIASTTAGSSSSITLDCQVQCLCCGKFVLINSESWRRLQPDPIALCGGCGRLPASVIKTIYWLKANLIQLQEKVTQLENDLFEPS